MAAMVRALASTTAKMAEPLAHRISRQPRRPYGTSNMRLAARAEAQGQHAQPAQQQPSQQQGAVQRQTQPQRGAVQRRGRRGDLQRYGGSSLLSPLATFPPSFDRLGSFIEEMQNEMDLLARAFTGTDIFGSDLLAPETTELAAVARPPVFAVDVHEDDKAFNFVADVPGLNAGDIKIKITPDNVLEISGERKADFQEGDEKTGYRRVERVSGKFMRRFVLPDNVDKEHITAKVENGVLKIVVPKAPKPKEEEGHEIKVEEAHSAGDLGASGRASGTGNVAGA